MRAPFNALCLLDPRNVDLFHETDEEMQATITTIKEDRVYNKLREQIEIRLREAMDDQDNVSATAGAADATAGEEPGSRRAQLLARKMAQAVTTVVGVSGVVDETLDTFDQKVDKEVIR
jgi:hypothetical protein